MKKFEGMLFCTDLDGTLLTDQRTISPQNRDAIEYFKSEGGLFTFITGRFHLTAQETYRNVQPNAPYGCINGGGIYDAEKEEYMWKTYMPEEAIELVRDIDRAFPTVGIQAKNENAMYFCKENETWAKYRKNFHLPNIICHYEAFKEPMFNFVFGDEDGETMDALSTFCLNHPLANRFEFIRSEYTLFEIMPKGTNKGVALRKLAELLGIDIKNTIAVGDYNNDIEMIKAAGKGFAVANAVPEAKAVADHITVSNNEHAIATIVEGLTNGTYRKPNSKIII